MVDLSHISAHIEQSRKRPHLSSNPRNDFLNLLNSLGFKDVAFIEAGKVVRIKDPLDKGSKKTGWYVYYETSLDHGIFATAVYGSYHGIPCERETWSSRNDNNFTFIERVEYSRAIEKAKAEEAIAREQAQNEAAENAVEIWKAAGDVTPGGYLERKGVLAAPDVREFNGDIVIPMLYEGGMCSIQKIKKEGEYWAGNNKKFLTGGRTKGAYFIIEGDGDVLICEGYATGASLHMATDAKIYICFTAANLYEVASMVKGMEPDRKIIICADNDHKTPGNPGLTKATQAAQGLELELKVPENIEGTDFNDYHKEKGIDALKEALAQKKKTYKKKNAEKSEIENPPGVLGQIVDYYNATSGSRQIGFAIQCALATGSIICARNYRTRFKHRTSLFFLNIGKSGTGKEHAKTVMEKIMESAELEYLIGGDGYTAGAAVFTALQDRPRHITVFDEFSKYLQVANNKNNNGMLATANTKIMECFGRIEGKMRPMNYANTGVDKEKRKGFVSPVYNPAITLMCMTTPDDFFENIGLTQIKDGFLNRFLIHISDAQRTLYEYREDIPVPDAISQWAKRINDRTGNKPDDFANAPEVVCLDFSFDAMKRQREFNQWCIDTSNKLDRFRMAELMNRANEIVGRVALITALARNPDAMIVEDADVDWAARYTQMCFEQLIERAKTSMGGSDYEKAKLEFLRAIRDSGDNGYSNPEMQNVKPFSKFKQKDIKDIMDSLRDGGQVFLGERKTGQRGRPVQVWLASED